MEKAVYLVSGGIDSPVAAYLGMLQGWRPIFVYFDNGPFVGKGALKRAMETICRVEEVADTRGDTIVVPHDRDLALMIERCRRNFTCLLCKRMMYRKAAAIAKEEGCHALVTGEILGEQASQTLRNLVLDSSVVDVPIVRPLLGMNKLEVEDIARRIGTLQISTSHTEPCTAAAIKARTRARAGELEAEEAKLPLSELVSLGLSGCRRINP